MYLRRLRLALLLSLNGLMLTTNAGANTQSHSDIYSTAQQFMLERVHSLYSEVPEINTDSLDSRLKLRQCKIPLEAFLPKGGRELGKITVGVRCSDDKPWSLYVPVRVSLYKKVLISTQPLERGKILTKDDLKLAHRDLSGLSRGYIEQPLHVLGMQTKRDIPAGKALTPTMLKKPRVIKKGQRVSMIVKSDYLEIRMKGTALMHGAAGERIRVHNLTSKQILEGTVSGPGEVTVDL